MPAAPAPKHLFSDMLARVRRIADTIAGMTDRCAQIEHARYFRETPELR